MSSPATTIRAGLFAFTRVAWPMPFSKARARSSRKLCRPRSLSKYPGTKRRCKTQNRGCGPLFLSADDACNKRRTEAEQNVEWRSMGEIAASKVMELRARTGIGMMECKKALTETHGDMAKAEELLRIKGGAKATKAADRIAAEGVIGAAMSPDAKTGAMVEVNCETDFVARNQDFVAFAKTLAGLIVDKDPADIAALSALSANGGSVEQARQALVQKLGENVSVRRFVRVDTADKLAQYLHGGGRIGVTVAYQGGDDQVGKDLAMHVAASAAPGAVRPVCV